MAEINVMGSVYRNATIIIAAANSESAKDGFLWDWPTYAPCTLSLLLPSGEFGMIYIEKEIKLKIITTSDNQSSPLDLRSWTLQEFLLSPRVLHFGLHDLSWHCQTHISGGIFSTMTSFLPLGDFKFLRKGAKTSSGVPEFPKRLPTSVFQGTHVKDGEDLGLLTDVWVAIVENHSNRALTDDKDRLPALAGVAGEFQRATRDEYICWNVER
jgi:hypothetical protein